MHSINPASTDSRRNFVKRSVALSIVAVQPSLLTGILRATGESGNGAADPWASTFFQETSEPNETTAATTVPHHRSWIEKIEVIFDTFHNHPTNPVPGQPGHDADFGDWSGPVYTGIMTFSVKCCGAGSKTVKRSVPIKSGGYLSGSMLASGSPTSCPPGTYYIKSKEEGKIFGWMLKNSGNSNFEGILEDSPGNQKKRFSIKLHQKYRYDGSSGCIVFSDKRGDSDYETFAQYARVNEKEKNCSAAAALPPASRHASCVDIGDLNYKIPFIVWYRDPNTPLNDIRPTFTWNRNKLSPIPASNPSTTPANPPGSPTL